MNICVRDIMDSKPLLISENDLLYKSCFQTNDSGAIVVNENKRPVGIITPQIIYDKLNVLKSNIIAAKELMEKDFISLLPTDPVENCTSVQNLWPVMEGAALVGAVYIKEVYRCLKESKDEYFCYLDHILKHSLNGIIIIDNDMTIKVFNQLARDLLKVTQDKLIGERIADIIPTTGLLKVLKSGETQDNQKLTLGDVTIIVNRRPIFRNGRIIGAISVLHDISQQELLALNLEITKKFNSELENILDACSEGIYISDGQGLGLRVNKAYERMTGINAKELLGKTMAQVVDQGLVSKSVTLKVLEKKRTVTITQKIKGREFLVTGNPIRNEQEQIYRVVTTVRDVTELNRLNQKIHEMNERSQKYYQELILLRDKKLDNADFVVSSKAMKHVVDMAFQVSQFDSTCLLLGESGVGKDVIARLIHVHSARRKKPFIKINCGAIPRELLEAELFGYETGAFTGARKEGKPGMFELAHTGTIFLDEIGEIPLDMQVKLLQMIQDRSIYRVGGTKSLQVDVRIITATNRDLEQMVKAGSFREDLYYRLNIIPIIIPPLRERIEDIIPLIELNLKQLNQKYETNKQLSPDAIQYLLNYPWPGNVRELKNIIERCFVISNGDVITTNQIPENILKFGRRPVPVVNKKRLKDAVEEVEKYLILETSKDHKSLSAIATELGVDKSTICRKIRRYKLNIDFLA